MSIPVEMFDDLIMSRDNGRFYAELCRYHRDKADRLYVFGERLAQALKQIDPNHPLLEEWKKAKKPKYG